MRHRRLRREVRQTFMGALLKAEYTDAWCHNDRLQCEFHLRRMRAEHLSRWEFVRVAEGRHCVKWRGLMPDPEYEAELAARDVQTESLWVGVESNFDPV